MGIRPGRQLSLTVALLTVWLLAACAGGNDEGPAGENQRMQVVSTTALLADLVRNVGRDHVAVRPVIPAGAEVHSFQTTPEDSIAIGNASLVVSNGLGLDEFLEPLLRNSMKRDALRVVATEGLDGLLSDDQASGEVDPHFWQDPLLTAECVEIISDGLIEADPEHAGDYRRNADEYIKELHNLYDEVAQTLSRVSPEHRHMVTYHAAFSHFGRRYGWTVSSLVGGDAGDVSPAAVVDILDRVRREGLKAVFVEPQFRSAVLEQSAKDMGLTVGTIYSDVLDEEVTTYIDMMRRNAETLAQLMQ